jgi:arginyl-tRNA--protein-N-Asp/Glu arginylyltransferase
MKSTRITNGSAVTNLSAVERACTKCNRCLTIRAHPFLFSSREEQERIVTRIIGNDWFPKRDLKASRTIVVDKCLMHHK